jgi:GT2 family glycosyltransferase
VEDDSYRDAMARAGQRFVRAHLSEKTIGARYAARLKAIKTNDFGRARSYRVEAKTSPAAQADDEIIGCLDRPPPEGVIPARSGGIEVSGWFASRSGIEAIDIQCDGGPAGRAYHGLLREDSGAAFPHLPDAARSGFFLLLDAERLAAGLHRLRVIARARNGASHEITRDFTVAETSAYQQWLATNALDAAEWERLAERAAELEARPLITLMLEAGSPADRAAISRSLASVADQIYADCEVVIAVGEADQKAVAALPAVAAIADRVRLVPSEQCDRARRLALCRGDFIGFLDPGDMLEPRALLAVAENIVGDGAIDLLYADEDRLAPDGRAAPAFKPAFSPICLDRHNYIGRPWFARAELLRGAANAVGVRAALSEHLLLKQAASSARAVCHIAMVLLSRPEAAARLLEASCECAVERDIASPDESFLPDELWPRVSIVIPTCLKDHEIVSRCFSGLIERTDYPDLEVIVVINNVADAQASRDFLAKWPFKVLDWEHPYTWSGINNFAAGQAAGEHLLFMNDDIDPLHPGWLKRMVRLGRMPSVGVVGAMLKYPNGAIQHAGVTIAEGIDCGHHLFRFRTGQEPAIAQVAGHDRECMAVTGACLLTRRDCFEKAAGFDESLKLVTNDIDYCLRLAERGYSTVLAAAAVLTHHEATSRAGMPEADDLERFWERWRTRLPADDPFTNPNLDAQKDDWSIDPGAVGSLQGRVWRKNGIDTCRK